MQARVATALLTLRFTVFLVMLMWTVDKFVNPDHAAGIFTNFYFIQGLEAPVIYLIGGIELLLIAAFVVGYQRQVSYGAVLLMHAVSTVSSYRQYLNPFDNLLFFAAWPMLAACFALYWLRDLDVKWALR